MIVNKESIALLAFSDETNCLAAEAATGNFLKRYKKLRVKELKEFLQRQLQGKEGIICFWSFSKAAGCQQLCLKQHSPHFCIHSSRYKKHLQRSAILAANSTRLKCECEKKLFLIFQYFSVCHGILFFFISECKTKENNYEHYYDITLT